MAYGENKTTAGPNVDKHVVCTCVACCLALFSGYHVMRVESEKAWDGKDLRKGESLCVWSRVAFLRKGLKGILF